MSLKYRLFAKILLKLPNPNIPFFVMKRFPLVEGIFYGLMLPVFMFLFGAFMLWLLPTATLVFAFPLNVLIVLLPPTVIFVVYVRMELERTINWWRSVFGSPTVWDSAKSTAELVELFKKQQNKTRK